MKRYYHILEYYRSIVYYLNILYTDTQIHSMSLGGPPLWAGPSGTSKVTWEQPERPNWFLWQNGVVPLMVPQIGCWFRMEIMENPIKIH